MPLRNAARTSRALPLPNTNQHQACRLDLWGAVQTEQLAGFGLQVARFEGLMDQGGQTVPTGLEIIGHQQDQASHFSFWASVRPME